MATPHIEAKKGDIASTVLMPGDPLRAKFIADHYLEDAQEFNQVRGMLGYTGIYHGEEVSVMGSGMGIPSIGIYSYELFTHYDVNSIIRVGSAGAYADTLDLYDLLLVHAAWSESSYARVVSGYEDPVAFSHMRLNGRLWESAERMEIPLSTARVHTTDAFYRAEEEEDGKPYWEQLRDEHSLEAVEMECFALFHNARVTDKQASALLTISDSFVTGKKTTANEREKNFTQMIEVALNSLLIEDDA